MNRPILLFRMATMHSNQNKMLFCNKAGIDLSVGYLINLHNKQIADPMNSAFVDA